MLNDVNELFLIDAAYLTGELQRFARGRQASAASAISTSASAADALGELLQTIGLSHYAVCSRRLSSRLRDPQAPLDADMGRAAAATLAARLNDLIEELRHKRLQDDGSDFAAMWLAEYGGDGPAATAMAPTDTAPVMPDVPDVPDTPEMADVSDMPEMSDVPEMPEMPDVSASVEPDAFVQAPDGFVDTEPSPLEPAFGWGVPDLPPEDAQAPRPTEAFSFENPQQAGVLAQARRLHARLIRLPAGPGKTALGEEVGQLLRSRWIASSQIGPVPLATPVSASLLSLGAIGVAFEQLSVCRAEPRATDAGLVCIDVEVSSSSASGMWAASKAIGHCGGRIDASPSGWRLTVPADTDLLSVVVIETDAGPLAVHALHFEAWVSGDAGSTAARDGGSPGGSLALRLGALEAEIPLRSGMASFQTPTETTDVLRHELPSPRLWPCPPGWEALVADDHGRLMPLLVPQAVHSGEQFQLTEFA